MNKKGFTLIELLAVIVILAIVAIIATPIVLDIINDTKRSAQLRGADFYIDAVEQAVTNKIMLDPTFNAKECKIQKDGNLLCSQLGFNSCEERGTNIVCGSDDQCLKEVKIQVSGERPTEGTIKLNKGQIEDVNLTLSNNSLVMDENNLVFKNDTEIIYETDVVVGSTLNIPDNFESNTIYNVSFTNPDSNIDIKQRGVISEENGTKFLMLESYLGTMTTIPLSISSSPYTGHLKIEKTNEFIDYSLRVKKNDDIYFYSKDFELGPVKFYVQLGNEKYALYDTTTGALQFSYKFGDYAIIGFSPYSVELYPAIIESYENLYIIVEQEIDGKKIIRRYGGTKPTYQKTHAYSEVNDSYYWGSDFIPFLGD